MLVYQLFSKLKFQHFNFLITPCSRDQNETRPETFHTPPPIISVSQKQSVLAPITPQNYVSKLIFLNPSFDLLFQGPKWGQSDFIYCVLHCPSHDLCDHRIIITVMLLLKAQIREKNGRVVKKVANFLFFPPYIGQRIGKGW